MRKFQKLSTIFLVALVAFGLGCTKKASQDEVNQLKDQIALLDSLANVGKDGFIRGTFTGSLRDSNTPVTYTFNYEYNGYNSDFGSDEDDDDIEPEYIRTARTEFNNDDSFNSLGFGMSLDLPGDTTPELDFIFIQFRTRLSNGQTLEYGLYSEDLTAETQVTFSNVTYSNGRLTGNFNWTLPEGHNSDYYGNTKAATVVGSFDIPAIVQDGGRFRK